MPNITKLEYTKKVMDIDGFIGRIKSKGFLVSDIDSAKDFLVKKGYYHISAYIKCFCETLNGDDITIIDGIDFLNVITLYNLDKELQEKLLNAVLEIEILVKADFIQKLSNNYGSPFWYLNRENVAYRAVENFKESVLKIQEDIQKSPACKHYFEKYKGEYLPIRHIVEFSSFGSFTKLFDYLKDDDLFLFCNMYKATTDVIVCDKDGLQLIYDKEQLKQRLKGLSSLRNRLAHSEITWSPKALPKIVLPGFPGELKLNTISSYIQLIYHFIKMIDINKASIFYNNCYNILLKISKIKGMHPKEFSKIGLTENREKRFE